MRRHLEVDGQNSLPPDATAVVSFAVLRTLQIRYFIRQPNQSVSLLIHDETLYAVSILFWANLIQNCASHYLGGPIGYGLSRMIRDHVFDRTSLRLHPWHNQRKALRLEADFDWKGVDEFAIRLD